MGGRKFFALDESAMTKHPVYRGCEFCFTLVCISRDLQSFAPSKVNSASRALILTAACPHVNLRSLLMLHCKYDILTRKSKPLREPSTPALWRLHFDLRTRYHISLPSDCFPKTFHESRDLAR